MKRNIIPVILIVLFSIVLWASVTLSGEFTATLKVPVQLIELPKNYSAGYISTREIYIRVKGKGWQLAKQLLGVEEKYVVSARRRIGRFRIDLRNEIENNNWLTSSFHVVEIAPAFVEIDIDRIVSKTVRLFPRLNLSFKEEYGPASDVTITPEHVEIFGPMSILKGIDTVFTEVSIFDNLSEQLDVQLNIEKIEGVEIPAEKCRVVMDVQKIVEKSFDGVLIEIRNVPPSKELILFPDKVSVVLQGGINKLGRLTNDSINVYVDYWQVLRENDEVVEPVVVLPKFTNLIGTKPPKIEYIIKQY